jgi:hypothetical protein
MIPVAAERIAGVGMAILSFHIRVDSDGNCVSEVFYLQDLLSDLLK